MIGSSEIVFSGRPPRSRFDEVQVHPWSVQRSIEGCLALARKRKSRAQRPGFIAHRRCQLLCSTGSLEHRVLRGFHRAGAQHPTAGLARRVTHMRLRHVIQSWPGGFAALRRLHRKKRLALPFHDLPYGHYTAPLGRFYFLTEPRDDDVLQITPLPARSAFLELLTHTFQLDIGNREQLKDNFARFARLTALPLFYQLSYPREWARLPEVGDAILRHAAA